MRLSTTSLEAILAERERRARQQRLDLAHAATRPTPSHAAAPRFLAAMLFNPERWW